MKNTKILDFLKEHHYIDHLPFISVGIIAGIVCCFYAKFFSYVEELNVKLMHSNSNLFFVLSPVLLSLSFIIVTKFAQGAAGSGIPQVMASIEKDHNHLSYIFLSVKVVIIKIISSLLAIFSGAAIGREGPSIQISAGIAHNIGRLSRRLGIHVKSDQLLIAGAASGLAAAFNTPIGGIVYAVEELAHEHVRSFKDTLLMSVVIAGFTAQLILGNYLYLGYPKLTPDIGFRGILIVSAVAIVCGMLGSIFSSLLLRLMKWRISKTFKTQIVIVALTGIVLTLFFVFFGERTILSGNESINYVLFNTGELPISEVILRFVSPLISSMTGIAGGIFAPALSAGAVLGGLAAEFIDPSLRNTLGLAGMIGFLTGVTRTPITSFVLVLEMTDRRSAVLPMMFASVFSSLGAHIFGVKSFYERAVEVIKENHGSKP